VLVACFLNEKNFFKLARKIFKTVKLQLIKYLQFKSRFGWSLSNLVAFLRWNLFTYRDLWKWIDHPFDALPSVPESVQIPLPLAGLGQHLQVKTT